MRTLRSLQFSAAALLTGGLWQAHAAYQAVDTFNALNDGAIGGQNGWVVTAGDTTTSTVVADPDIPSNKVLKHTGINDAYKLLPTPIADASGGTFFYRVRLTSLSNDVSFGLSDQNPPSLTDFGTFEVQNNATNTDGRFGTRDGTSGNPGGFGNRAPLFNMTSGVWYNIWLVADTTADTFRIYVQSDGHAAYATQTEIVSPDGAWNFRNPAAANPLQAFVIMSNSSATNLYFDDIYIDPLPTANLANPLNEINPDADNDGLEDAWETLHFGNTTAQNGSGDPDADGFTNLQEYTAGSNPTVTASTPNDTDADGLLDSWEVTHFGSKSAQNGAGDFDGDGATNLAEHTAGTNPANAASWPDTDSDGLRDAWEIAYFGNLTTANGGGDADSDGFSNLAEMQAGSDPTSAAWTPNQAALVHRWSFNGDLNDSVGASHATLFDPDNNAATGGASTLDVNAVTLAGGASTTSTAVRLGGNLIGGRSTPVTIQLWATQNAVQNWGRIFDFGSGTTEYLFMSWTRTTDLANDQVEWLDAGVSNNRGTTNATSYALGAKHHIVLTLTPAAYTNGALATGTRVTWYIAPADSAATVVAKGSFDTINTLANLNDVNNYLGRSMWPGDNVASATYDEVRIWNGALSASTVNTHQLAGPNAFTIIDTDSDGLSDTWEQAFFGNLAQGPNDDPDTDGFSNLQEYNAGSNPTVTASTPSDTDGDGLPDSWEIEHFGNLAQTADGDPDGDLATNLQEYNAQFTTPFFATDPNDNTSFPDSDFDGMNDAWELIHFGTLAAGPNDDPDDDGSTNSQEYDFRLDPNDYLSSRDSDSDGLSDGWEIHYFKLPGETGLNNINDILPRQDATGDPDGDLFDNSLELAYLTDPTDIASVPGDVNNDGINDGPVLKLGGDAVGTDSFTTGLNWHDGLVPTAGKSYTVGVAGLRSPESGDHTFAGDRLVLINVGTRIGNLIWKNVGTLTIPILEMRGGRINQAAGGGSTVTLNGSLVVSGPADIWANNGGFLINSAVSGDADLTLTGNGLVTLAGAVTSTGDLVVNAHSTAATTNRLTLATTGSIEFTLGADGATNVIGGAGAITLDGSFVIDPAAVSGATLGDDWTLVATTGNRTYGSTFSVSGYASDGGAVGARKWTSLGSAPFFQFDEATGVLTVVENPDSDNDGLIDTWEITHFGDLSHDGTADTDNDGSTDEEEFLAGTNPTDDTSWPDTDNDGVKDSWELATFGNLTTATATDQDGDGLPDAWELTYFASIATQNATDDSDNDTFSNSAELTARSNPALAASVPGDINADGIADGQRLVTADAGGTNSFVNGLNWADALAPSAGKNYFVDINSLRTPNDAADYSFAGDRLVIFTGGNLLVKGSGALTFPLLNLDGGRLHNGTDGNVVATVAGSIAVTRASEIYAQNQGFVLNAALSGTGNLTLTGGSPVTIAGTNTWRGGLALTNTGGLVLAETGNLVFAPGANGVTNAITGTNPAVLNGTFNIDTSAASTAPGASWVLVATSGAKTYGATFTVSGYVADGGAVGARKWTSGSYTFDEATGTLSMAGTPVSGLADWRQTHFGTTANEGSAADSADPDADGRPNLLEYALGTDPTEADSGAPVAVAVQAGVLTLTFDHIGDATLSYVIEASNDLATWTPAQTYTGLSAAGTITYTDTVALSSTPRRFLRLEVATAP